MAIYLISGALGGIFVGMTIVVWMLPRLVTDLRRIADAAERAVLMADVVEDRWWRWKREGR